MTLNGVVSQVTLARAISAATELALSFRIPWCTLWDLGGSAPNDQTLALAILFQD